MTVALFPPLLLGPPDDRVVQEALEVGPVFIRQAHPQRAGVLWHRPRSGQLTLAEWAPDRIRTTWQLWCGTFSQDWKAETVDVLPAGGVVCATCDGRARGAGQLARLEGPVTRFEPRHMRLPRTCPGSGRSGLWSEHGPRTGRCGVCGAVEPTRYMGGPYGGDVGLARHEPAQAMLEVRCDLHGWRHLVLAGDRAVCRCSLTRA